MKEKLIYVIWNDAVSVDAWTDISEITPELAEIHSVGFLVCENKEVLTIALNVDTTNLSASCIMNIPKKWIRFRKNITKK